MITLEKIPFTSVADRPLTLYLWQTDAPCRGVIQLVHGMAEHIARYDRLARALCAAGYTVAGHSHLGHGEDAREDFFAQPNGNGCGLQDIHTLRTLTQKEHPQLPYFILGHSMGSFVTREYLLRYGGDLTAAVICGTGWFPGPLCSVARAAAALCGVFGGWQKPAPLVDRLMSKDNNKAFAPARTPFDWLSRDTAEVDKYMADLRCGFLFTARGYYDMFTGLKSLSRLHRLAALPGNLPVLFISGDADPIGTQGKGVSTVAQQFRDAGVRDVTVRLYPGARHELFNETNAELIDWLNRHMK